MGFSLRRGTSGNLSIEMLIYSFCDTLIRQFSATNEFFILNNFFDFVQFQVSNGPINNSHSSTPISSNSVQSGLAKTISSTAKMPPSSSTNASSPGKQQQQLQKPSEQQPQRQSSPFSMTHSQRITPSPSSYQQLNPELQMEKRFYKSFSDHQRDELARRNCNDIDVTIAVTAATSVSDVATSVVNCSSTTTSIPSIPTTHPISTPLIASPISNQAVAITNGNTPNNQTSIGQPPASLPVSMPHPPPAAAPTIAAPSTHSALDSSVAASGRTNSPAVATSAVLSAVAPAINGNSNATTVSANGGIGPYRQGYAPYALYAPYIAAHMHHSSPYIPPAIPSPSASPRMVDSRSSRESPMITSKGIRPMTPTTINNGIQSQLPAHQSVQQTAAHQSASSSSSTSLREPSQHSTPLSLQKAHSPRGHSPTRERDSYR